MMDTDYKHYAIVYSQQKDSQEPSTMLQLYSGCLSNGGGQGWDPHCHPRPLRQHPACQHLPTPKESILG